MFIFPIFEALICNSMAPEEFMKNWSYYDHQKRDKKQVIDNFFCSELWEVNFLIDKIRIAYNNIPEEKVRSAITSCCIELKAPQERKKFVSCVLSRLHIT